MSKEKELQTLIIENSFLSAERIAEKAGVSVSVVSRALQCLPISDKSEKKLRAFLLGEEKPQGTIKELTKAVTAMAEIITPIMKSQYITCKEEQCDRCVQNRLFGRCTARETAERVATALYKAGCRMCEKTEDNDDSCVSCGGYAGEGRQICVNCESLSKGEI